MKYIALPLVLIITGIIVWMNIEIQPRVPPESAVRVVRSDSGDFVVCDGADLNGTYLRLHKMFENVSAGDRFQILIEPLPLNKTLEPSEVHVRVFPNGDVSLFSDGDTGTMDRSDTRGSSSGGSGDYIAMSLQSEIGYAFMSDETKEASRKEMERLMGAKFSDWLSNESSETTNP